MHIWICSKCGKQTEGEKEPPKDLVCPDCVPKKKEK